MMPAPQQSPREAAVFGTPLETEEVLERFRAVLNSLASLPPDEWEAFKPRLRIKSKRRHSQFLNRPKSHPVAFVFSGLFKTSHIPPEGHEYIRCFVGPGSFVGDYSKALSQKSPTTVIEALQDSVIVEFDFRDFAAMYPRHSSWEAIGRRVAECAYLMQEEKAFIMATSSAKTRVQLFLAKHAHLANQITKRDIAAYLGMTPVSLSRVWPKKSSS